jgi:outer membrane receptor protein involved in Fe transport
MEGEVFWDLDVAWDINDTLSVTIGGNNIFDARAGPPPSFRSCCGAPIHRDNTMDWQGSYYYIRGAFRWN